MTDDQTLIQIRERSFLDLLDLTLVVLRRRPATLGLAAMAGVLPCAAINAWLTSGPDFSLYEGTQMANPAAYGASKGGLDQLTRYLATALAPRVRVNTLSPGGIARQQPAVFAERYAARTPLGRMGTEEDVKGAIAFLASDASAYVTGQSVFVDGGWSAW